jgi:hypothetical protein
MFSFKPKLRPSSKRKEELPVVQKKQSIKRKPKKATRFIDLKQCHTVERLDVSKELESTLSKMKSVKIFDSK